MRPVSRNNDMLVKPLFLALLFLAFSALYGQEVKNAVAPIDVGKQWAVFIAIDRYNEWSTLGNPVRDAKEIRDILVSNYLIHEVRELYNSQATADNVRNLLKELQQQTGIHDSVFVFYAGAGQIDKFTEAGSWMLMPREKDPIPQTNQISNEEVQQMLAFLPARHVFLISDACFFGEGLDTSPRDVPEVFTREYYNQVYNKISRQVMTSGAVKTGPGSSEFIKRLKSTLREAEEPYIDSEYLFAQIQGMETPKPLLGVIRNAAHQEKETLLSRGTAHQEGGSFLFFKHPFFSNPMPLVPPISSIPVATGNITITSEIPGMIMIQGVETGTRIRANANAVIWNVPIGNIEVAVKWDDGRIVRAFQPAAVQEGETAKVMIERPFIDRFVRIPGGTFKMGSSASEMNRSDDEIQHEVSLRDFYMEAHEVSLEEFELFVIERAYKTDAEISGGGYVWTGTRWEMTSDANWMHPHFSQNADHPVVLVSWLDAIQYCNWRSEREGLEPAYVIGGSLVTWNENAGGYRLPTEAEWEYAARGGTATPFSTGNTITAEQANFNGNYPYNNGPKGTYRQTTTPVGSFSPNPWGLYDMHGNVWEWCWDLYGTDSSENQTEHIGDFGNAYRVRRGGSWSYAGEYLRSAYRSYSTQSARYNSTGFRLVRSIQEKNDGF